MSDDTTLITQIMQTLEQQGINMNELDMTALVKAASNISNPDSMTKEQSEEIIKLMGLDKIKHILKE